MGISMISSGLGRSLAAATVGLALLSPPTLALAQDEQPPPAPETPPAPPEDPGPQQTDADTMFQGAIMLEGEVDVTFDGFDSGEIGGAATYNAGGRYAYFTGNTLYAGCEDDQNNYVDMIAEFFWFQSSEDRGSDFYVAVVKARTSPNLSEWRLNHDGTDFLGHLVASTDATLYLRAKTDLSTGSNAFRWDWSIPFDNYAWDAFGSVSMETKYGVGVSAEGSAQTATEWIEGQEVKTNVQAKGFFDTGFQVQSRYEVTLHRWETVVHGGAGQIDWQLMLHNADRENQNAYHEFFVVMQAEEGRPFTLESLEVGGNVKKPVPFWFDEHRDLSVKVTNLTLSRPTVQDDDAPTQTPEPPGRGDEEEPNIDDDETPDVPDEDVEEPETVEGPTRYTPSGCAIAEHDESESRFALLLAAAAVAYLRRRR